jgi:hypothetical protein
MLGCSVGCEKTHCVFWGAVTHQHHPPLSVAAFLKLSSLDHQRHRRQQAQQQSHGNLSHLVLALGQSAIDCGESVCT